SDGIVHFSAESLTYFNSRLPIVGMWLVNGDGRPFDVDRFIDQLGLQGSVNFQKLTTQETSVFKGVKGRMRITKKDIQETTRKVPRNQIKKVAQAIRAVSSTQGENLIGITEEARDAIKNADAIVYSNVLLQRDLAPILIVPGIRQAIEQATHAVKINLGVIRRTQQTRENEILKKVKHIYRYLRNVEGERQAPLEGKVSQYIDYVLESYLKEQDERKVYQKMEPIKKQTQGKVSTIALKVQFDEQQRFSSELLESIIALVGIKRAGFKIVDGGVNTGKLVLAKLSSERREWKKGQMGLFTRDRTVHKVISDIQTNWETIRRQGGFVFDVDKTILPKGAESFTNYRRLAYLFMRLLREEVKVAIISANSKEEQMHRIVDAIKVQMKNNKQAMENLTFYVNGGATKIGFTDKGEEDLSRRRIKTYNLQHAMDKTVIGTAIEKAIRELSARNFGLQGEALDLLIEEAKKKYPKLDLQASWKNGSENALEIEYHTAQDILDLENRPGQEPAKVIFPWVEKRGEIITDNGEVKYGSLAIKPVPRLNKLGVDPRKDLIEAINRYLGDYKDKLYVRLGGGTTVDITSVSAQKDTALEDFIATMSKAAGVDAQENKKNFFYFGDEFFEKGNDEPIKKTLPRGNIFAVNDGFEPVTPEAIHIGRSPQAVKEFLEEILIKPAEISSSPIEFSKEAQEYINLLSHPDPDQRANAVVGLREIHEADTIDLLAEKGLSDENEGVRTLVQLALEDMGATREQWLRGFEYALSSGSKMVRDQARMA
ncbi:MAG TPA: 2-phospho-L-lactate transferase CofD family protein, partial [Candidatus Omnitrophota bacterium]|nr:2-phospho-L-lactate transferase CofD family protein [Candidatus Omnitrophota bacterium]